MSKFVEQILKGIIIFLIFFGIFMFFSCGDSSGCENNFTTSQEEETKQFLKEHDQDLISQQRDMMDFYSRQKELIKENKKLRDVIERQLRADNEELNEIIRKQEAELEKKEEQIKIQEQERKAHVPIEHHESSVKNVEQVAQQVVKETARVVHKTDREVKRILKKF